MDTFAQIMIPFLIVLAARVDTRKALLMLPFTLVLDLDIFFPGLHRSLFHNVFVAFIIPLIIVILVYKYKPKHFQYAWIAFFFIIASLILDLGTSVALFYPFVRDFYYFRVSLYLQSLGPLFVPDLHIEMGVWAAETTQIVSENMGASDTATSYPSVSETSSGLFFTLGVAALMYYEKSFQFLRDVRALVLDIIGWLKGKVKGFMGR